LSLVLSVGRGRYGRYGIGAVAALIAGQTAADVELLGNGASPSVDAGARNAHVVLLAICPYKRSII